jgi:hypothetical protein
MESERERERERESEREKVRERWQEINSELLLCTTIGSLVREIGFLSTL